MTAASTEPGPATPAAAASGGRSGPVELVRVLRSGFHEGSHFGHLVITDPSGAVVLARGNVTAPVFPRSSSKPFQAIAMLGAGADLIDADLALAAASHSGEAMHTQRVQGMLARSGLGEDDLGCPPDLPLDAAARTDVLVSGGGPRRVYMNCSGKHAGMLTACVARGWDTTAYLDPAHPMQQAIRSVITDLAQEEPSAVGVDGCGAPLFAISLVGLARAFGAANAAAPGTPAATVSAAMRSYPEMVGGTGREDTRLMQAHPGLLVKGGAEGVHCAALPDGHTVAVKITDGGDRARMPALVAGLRWLGLRSSLLDELGTGTVLGGGSPVGTVTAVPGLL